MTPLAYSKLPSRHLVHCSIWMVVFVCGSIGRLTMLHGADLHPTHDPLNLDTFDVPADLKLSLFAAEPHLLSLTNLDIDSKGRIWVCEVVNYRGNNGKRAEGDRILILEDRDGDGRADHVKTYYQGHDVDSAMGICVLGNKLIVSCSPNVWVFTDEDGDDRPDRKELLFTKTGQAQHDHSAHSFVFGPDGKLLWNFGNTGHSVSDAQGKIIRDRYGREVIDNGHPFHGGMIFRCDLQGNDFEVLAHNFRNNYEVCVDSFGNIWQSDNDDDGNKAVRINYIIPQGNYGYRDEITGAGWQEPRTNWEAEIPVRHWHQNDPGVIPNMLITGAGAPSGIACYEGNLLPSRFWGNLLHCDPGPNVVRCYAPKPIGSGFQADVLPIAYGARDNWFRPADVCVAPDGSLFITDWYDPGVGGHAMQDIERGRLYRVAPAGKAYRIPRCDVSTPKAAVQCLASPNQSVRYDAWTALHGWGIKAEPALAEVWQGSVSAVHRARCLWLLSQLPQGSHYLQEAIQDGDPRMHLVALRAAHQNQPTSVLSLMRQLSRDTDPGVRRECAALLFGHKEPEAVEVWVDLASQYTGGDRWMLESLGIGAATFWDEALAAWLSRAGTQAQSPAGREILWRSRAKQSAKLLTDLLLQTSISADEQLRVMRAFDFLDPPTVSEQLVRLVSELQQRSTPPNILLLAEALKRLPTQANSDATQWALAMVTSQGKQIPDYLNLLRKFGAQGHESELVAGICDGVWTAAPAGEAVLLLLQTQGGVERLTAACVESHDASRSLALFDAMGQSADERVLPILLTCMNDATQSPELRQAAARQVVRIPAGAKWLVQEIKEEKLPQPLKSAVTFPLLRLSDPEIRAAAESLLIDTQATPLPPLPELLQLNGNTERGKSLFAGKANCNKCHSIAGPEPAVGPNLAEIGSKLSVEAMWEALLYPDAAISHGYESYSLVTHDGKVHAGRLISRTPQEVVLKTAENQTITVAADQVDALEPQTRSLMPGELQKILDPQSIADVIAYLRELRRP